MARASARAAVGLAALFLAAGCGGGDKTGGVTRSQSPARTQTATTTVAPTQQAATSTQQATTTTAVATASKRAFIKRMDHACAAGNAALKLIRGALQRALSRRDWNGAADAVARARAAASTEAGAMSQIEPPPGDRELVSRLIGAYREVASRLGDVEDDLRAHDERAAGTDVTKMSTASGRAHGLAQGYGFKVCGTGANQ